ncbi:MAG: hypothetical protein M0T83_10035, partial [Nitrospiraceae bacterium]|nr:hypothetical protein [Nitrospiraceae bacterium]
MKKQHLCWWPEAAAGPGVTDISIHLALAAGVAAAPLAAGAAAGSAAVAAGGGGPSGEGAG